MKKIIFLLSVILTTGLMGGCVATPAGPSIASLDAGSDAVMLNKKRGSAGAQITKAQAEQYKLQQDLAAREQALEDIKRRETINNLCT